MLCDVLDHHQSRGAGRTRRAPCCSKQIARLDALGMASYFASELEFYLFDETYESVAAKDWRDLKTAGSYIQDYHILQTTKEEGVLRAIRNGLQGAGIPVENSKGEWGPGQEEINVRYADALTMADWHVILKNGCKEIAPTASGQGDHLHGQMALRPCRLVELTSTPRCGTTSGKTPLFLDPDGEHGMSALDAPVRGRAARSCARDHLVPRALHQFLQALPGRHLRADQGDLVARQSHRRLPARAAPTRKAIRIECRIGGADLNPYLAIAALIAAGLAGIEQKTGAGARPCRRRLSRQEPARGAEDAARGHRSDAWLEDAARAFGDEVVDHYVHNAEWGAVRI